MALYDAVFEGGGAKGIAFLGALHAMAERGDTIRRVIGTSAGAITAALVAAHFTCDEIREIVLERTTDGEPRFLTFLEKPQRWEFSDEMIDSSALMNALREIDLPLIPGQLEEKIEKTIMDRLLGARVFPRVFSLVERGGYFSANDFLAWLQEKLALKGIGCDDTLGGIAARGCLDLTVVGSDTTGRQMLCMNARTSPDLPVCWAVRMSMSIPFVWPEVIWREEWGLYRGRDITGNRIVDGGALSNFPIRYVATMDDEVRAVMGDTDPYAALNIGLLIDDNLEVPGQNAQTKPPSHISGLKTMQRLQRIIDTITTAHDNEMIHRFEQFIVHVPAKGYGTLEFDLKEKRLEDFIAAARTAAKAYLSKSDNLQR